MSSDVKKAAEVRPVRDPEDLTQEQRLFIALYRRSSSENQQKIRELLNITDQAKP